MTLHVVGAGLAGLACALDAADAGLDVVVHEGAKQAGGRCRSFEDAATGRQVDNGTHVVLGGNRATRRYLRRIGAETALCPLPLIQTVADLVTGRRWTPSLPGMVAAVASSLWNLGLDDRGTVFERLGAASHYRLLWEPMATASLNTDARAGSAALFRAVLRESVWRGPAAARMHVSGKTLSATFVEPALRALAARGARIGLGRVLRRIEMRAGAATELVFDSDSVVLGRNDMVVLALPWWADARLIGTPELPDSPIVNAHFRAAAMPDSLADGQALGILGGTAQWVFRRGDVLSVTVSAAAQLVEADSDAISEMLWNDLRRALDLRGAPVAARIVKEKRATLLHTPETESRRPATRLGDNLFLAGDWTATGLPCTIEGAIRSGRAAATEAARVAEGAA